jgi:3-deoxy-D-manno-octulosonic-acid transferase
LWSQNKPGSATGRFVLDTIGELRRAYAMADLVVVGRSFGALHGSDPMEPAALGKPVIIGPRFEDFTQSVRALEAAGALRVVKRDALAGTLRALIASEETRRQMGTSAIECVRAHRGASARHAELLLPLLSARPVPGGPVRASEGEIL